ncbi:hypothetical protein [Alcaligenes sp. SDU_A2]|uniref:hypothetical protein n=1 Tax=Alcaligenes sp. SDU_A2 TaxID=3136634 RepID=UPI00311E1FAD
MTGTKEITIRDPKHGREVFTNESFRVDHPFRTTRQIFGPNVLDTEGSVHLKRKRIWNTTFGRRAINSEPFQEIICDAVRQGLIYAQSANNLYLAATYIPNKIVLDVLGCSELDPLTHFEQVRPLIGFLESGHKPDGYAQAKQYVRNPMFYQKAEFFEGLSDKERENDIALLVGAGIETTVISLKILMSAWARDPNRFKAAIEHHGVETFVELLLNADPPLGIATKYCSQPTSFKDVQLEKGDIVHVSILDANQGAQCPFQHAAPSNQDNGPALTFGLGRHHCPGHLLAKAELAELARALLKLDPAHFDFLAPSDPQEKRALNFRHPPDWIIRNQPL